MLARRSGRACCVGALLLLGVVAARGEPPPTLLVTPPPTAAQLRFIEGRDAVRVLGERRPVPVDPESASERQLQAYCSNGEAQRAAADKGFLTDVVSAILAFVLDKAAERVRSELARYSAISERTSRVDYYRGGPDGAGNGRPDSRYTCLRFTRFAADSGDRSDVALDFVAGIGLDTDHNAILLRPLRLYVSKAGARSVNGKYAVAIMVHAEAVWRESVVGHQGTIFDQTIASEAVDLTGGPFLTYYPTEPLGGRRVPVIPVSIDSDRSRDFGRADFTVSAAEVGVQPATLTLLAQFLPTTQDRRTRLLLEAAAIASQPLL